MNHTDLLQGYDMLTAITQTRLNRELQSCFQEKQIPHEINFKANTKQGDKVKLDIEVSLDGKLAAPSLAIMPGVNDSQKVLFGFRIEEAVLSSSMFSERLSIKDWNYVFPVALATQNLSYQVALDREDIPQKIKNQLVKFPKNNISLTVVHISFEQLDLSIYDPTSHCPMPVAWGGGSLFDKTGQNEEVLTIFQACLQEYFAASMKDNRSYILGYMVTSNDAKQDFNSLPLFNPTGCNYTVTYCKDNPDLSTLNLMLVTNDHPLPTSIAAGLFQPWINTEGVDGRIVIGRSLLFNRWILPKLNNALAWSTAKGDTKKIKQIENESGWLFSNNSQKSWESKSITYHQEKKHEVQVSFIADTPNQAKVNLSGDYENHLNFHDAALAKGSISATQKWSITIQFLINDQGVITTKVIPDINKPAIVTTNENWAMKILSALMLGQLKSQMDQEGNDWASYEHELAACLMDQLSGNLSSKIVLPNGEPIITKGIAFDDASDLMIDIQLV